jgi:DNA-binding response OmpR family regulator
VPSPSKHVLLVEDDPFLYKVLSQRLADEGITVTVASEGDLAVQEATRLQPVLILLDLILPKKSGFDVLKDIRNTPTLANTPVVVLSNLGQQEDIAQIEKLGVREYLIKADYSLAEMVEKIREHLDAVT